MDEVARQKGGFGPPGGQLPKATGTKRPAGQEHTDGFQKVGLALGVPAAEDVQAAGWTIGKSLIIAKITKTQAANLHPLNLPFLDENRAPKCCDLRPKFASA
jgi:hypothetical protein